ncbi:MAG: class I SAM-dependent methyltransferase [Planctomycetes bacterium]|nr:class I SAM-dependent methyltransferase [Planctomycetota bacterium]
MEGYGDLCSQFYDLDKPRAPVLALAWFHRELAGIKGRVLEPMCGSGRFLAPLAERGIAIDGVDPSASMLDACRKRVAWRGVQLWQQSLEELDLGGRRYAGAFIPASSFCLLHEPAVAAKALERLRAHLESGALVLIEFEPPYDVAPSDVTRTVTAGGRQIRLAGHSEYDAATQIETMTNRYELKQSGKVVQTEDEVLHLRCYTPEQMVAELTAAGFTNVTTEHPEFGWVAKATGGP